MALTVTLPGDDVIDFGPFFAGRKATLIPDTAYPTGGYLITGQAFGMSATGGGTPINNGIHGIDPLGMNTAAFLYTPVYNAQTGALQILTAGAEVANGTNLSALNFYVLGLFASL